MDDLAANPFSALFANISEARTVVDKNSASPASNSKRLCVDSHDLLELSTPQLKTSNDFLQSKPTDDNSESNAVEVLKTSFALERIFLLTVDLSDYHVSIVPSPWSERPNASFLLEDHADHDWLELDMLSTAVFERLMTGKEELHERIHSVVGGNLESSTTSAIDSVVVYLFQCFERLKKERKTLSTEDYDACADVILVNARTSLQTPDVYEGQDPMDQFFGVVFAALKNDEEMALEFFSRVLENYDDEMGTRTKSEVLEVFYHRLMNESSTMALGSPQLRVIMKSLQFFSTSVFAVQVFFRLCTPKPLATPVMLPGMASSGSRYPGRDFENSLLGRILAISPIPGNKNGAQNFFEAPSQKTQQEIDAIQHNLWLPLESLRGGVHDFFHRILRLRDSGATASLLGWIGAFYSANKGRSKLGNQLQTALPLNFLYASDGLCLNLSAVLLMMTKPFSGAKNPKLLKIDPRYASSPSDDPLFPRAIDLIEETKLLPDASAASDGQRGDDDDDEIAAALAVSRQTSTPSSFGLTTDLFFLAHGCFQIGFTVVSKAFLEMNQEMHQLQTAFRESLAGGNTVPDLKERLETLMSKYLSIQAVLLEPGVVSGADGLLGASMSWINHLAATSEVDGERNSFDFLSLPLSPNDASTSPLRHVPELIVNNVIEFVLFTHRFNRNAFANMEKTLEELLTFIVVFMGDKSRMKNPHLKAQLAELLETTLPAKDEAAGRGLFSASLSSDQLFLQHPHRREIAPALLRVFVSIEMTGESVDEYMIYNYRRPMYKILKHLWRLPEHNARLVELADQAYATIEYADPPLFLKFINFLCNDAVYLLDEALRMMKEIREKEQEKQRGEWQSLTEAERREKENQLSTIVKHSRYYNIMGKETLKVLSLLTSKIVDIFVHPVMLERISTMLNYFLFKLCGPSRKDLKVADFERVDFDPAELVAIISKIYINLHNVADFCKKCLLMLLDSPLNRAGLLQVYIHTAKNVLIEVHPQTRIPRTFDRFCGLMVQLLYKLSIHASDGPQKLLKVIKNPVSDHFPPGCRKLCSSFKASRCVNAKELVPKPEEGGVSADTPIVIAVGAMAHGSLNLAYTEEDVAISGYPLSAALTCAKLCSAFEEGWDVL